MAEDIKQGSLLPMVTEIVAAHLSNNSVAVTDIPRLINRSLCGLDRPHRRTHVQLHSRPTGRRLQSRSRFPPGFIICLEDGRNLRC